MIEWYEKMAGTKADIKQIPVRKAKIHNGYLPN
jgi:hypothetical protein